jgi:hypothetical protein
MFPICHLFAEICLLQTVISSEMSTPTLSNLEEEIRSWEWPREVFLHFIVFNI